MRAHMLIILVTSLTQANCQSGDGNAHVSKKPATFFHFGEKDYPDAKGATPDYSFPAYGTMLAADKMGLTTQTKPRKGGLRAKLKHAWAWDKQKFQNLKRSFTKALRRMKKPWGGKKCKKGSSSETLMLNSCLYSHLLQLNDALNGVLGCTSYTKADGSHVNKWQTNERKECWLAAVHALPTNLASCCHDKLEKQHHCEPDAKPIYKMELQLRQDFKVCSGFTYKQPKGQAGTWTKTSKGDQKICDKVAQKLFYLQLDVKDWYMGNARKTGGMSAQCEEDQDDDWINSGDPGR